MLDTQVNDCKKGDNLHALQRGTIYSEVDYPWDHLLRGPIYFVTDQFNYYSPLPNTHNQVLFLCVPGVS